MIIDDHMGSIEFSVSVGCRKKNYTILLFQTIVETTKKNYYIDAYKLWTVTQLKMITMWIIIKSLERNNNFSLHQSNHSILYVRMNKNEFTKYNFGRGLHSMGQLGASKTKRKIFT